MSNPQLLSLALLLLFTGLILWLVVSLVIRLGARRLSESPRLDVVAEPPTEETEACIVLEPGGRLVEINAAALQLFELSRDDAINLERLARRARPTEAFLGLCAVEGSATFVLNGQNLQGASHRLLQPQELMVITLRLLEQSVAVAPSGEKSDLPIYDFSHSLELDATLESIFKATLNILPCEFLEITLWDEGSETFIPYRYQEGAGGERQLVAAAGRYQRNEGLTGRLAESRQPLLITDVAARPDLRLAIERSAAPFRAFLGVPLLLGQNLLGTLELGALSPETFRENDIPLFQGIAAEATAALNNALRFRNELNRSAELAGLAQLAQAFSAARDPLTLFSRLIESILPLMPVEILGFLIYNDYQHALEGRAPFHGLPDQFMDAYRAPITTNSRMEQTMLDQDVILSENAFDDPQWEVLGLAVLSQSASLRETVLIPLTSSGRLLGYLQASNHTDGSRPFSSNEIRLLTIIANQAAPIIENAGLVQQSRQRAQRAEGLRRIASLVGSSANLDEILTFSLQELLHLLQADAAFFLLFDQNKGTLVLHRASLISQGLEIPDQLATLSMDDPQYHFTITGKQRSLVLQKRLSTQPIIPFYQKILNLWQMESVLAAPLIVRDQGIGEVWILNKNDFFYDQADLQVVVTAAGQLAGVVEQGFLNSQTDEGLRRQVDHLTALSRINRELSTTLDLTYLLQLVYDEALRSTRADCGTIMLFDLSRPSDQAPVIRFYVGDALSGELTEQELQILRVGEVVNIPDVIAEPMPQAHAGIHSLLLVPIIYQSRPAGLIVMHGNTPERFDPASVEISKALAAQAAVALGNAVQYEEQTRRSELLKRQLVTTGHLFQVSQILGPDQPLEEALAAISTAIREITPFQVVLISVFDPETNSLHRVHAAGMDETTWQELNSHTQPWQAVESLLQKQFKNGSVYYIPFDQSPVVPEDVHFVSVLPVPTQVESDGWHTDDFLLVPLYDNTGAPLGLVSLDAPSDHRRPDRPTLDALELFASQAALMIETHRKMNALQNELQVLLSEQEQVQAEREQTARMKTRVEDQDAAIAHLNRQMDYLRTGLETAEASGRQGDLQTALRSLSLQLMEQLGMQTALIAEKSPGGLRLREMLGQPPAGVNPEAFFGQRNPIRQALIDGQVILSGDLSVDTQWRGDTLLNGLSARSFIVLPLNISRENSFAVLVVGQKSQQLVESDVIIYQQLARQVSLSLQNIHLLGETNRRLNEVNLLLEFTRQIGSLDEGDVLRALVDLCLQALPEADSAWVALKQPKENALVIRTAAGFTRSESLLSIPISLKDSTSLPVRVFNSGQSLRVSEVHFAQDYTFSAGDLLLYRQATGAKLPVSSMVVPLRRANETLGVLVLDSFDQVAAFSEENEMLALSLTQQSALALENARLYSAAQSRAAQLLALNSVASAMTASLATSELEALLLDQLAPVLLFDTATLWLRRGNDLQVSAARGFPQGEAPLNVSVSVQDSTLFQEMIRTGQAIHVPDVREDIRFPSLIEPERLSWLGIPLLAKAELIGVIAIEKKEAEFYLPEQIQAAVTFASQSAISLENARLYEESVRRATELTERSQRLALLNRLSTELGQTLDVDLITHLTAEEMLSALKPNRVAVILINSQGRCTVQVEIPETKETLPMLLPETPLFTRLSETRGSFSTQDAEIEPELRPLWEAYLQPHKIASLLLLPLVTGNNLLGWVMCQNAKPHRYGSSETDLARTICNQAAVAMQNARLYVETRLLTEDLEKRVSERTIELRQEHQNTQTLLRIITELSSSLEINAVLIRTMAVLNESTGAEQSLILMVANPNQSYRAGLDLAPVDRSLPVAKVEQEISRWVIRKRTPTLVTDISNEPRWPLSGGVKPEYRSVLAVPLIVGEDVLGSLLLFHRQPGFFYFEIADLVEAAARQIAVALNNSELFNLIRDQSERLGGMLRDQQIESNRSRAILEAVADGVLVTDATNRITLVNPSSERILNLKFEEVVGKPLEQFSGIFGIAGDEWMQTIERWSTSPEEYQSGDSYGEQISLDNGRVVAVNLAPVIWRSTFLGTVSIFRDITHEVRVDRLKTEFIANVSHELRTPLTSIKGYAEVMLMGASGQVNDQQRHFLTVIKTNAERLGTLVNELLDVSRIESGRVTISSQPVDIRPLATNAMDAIRARSSEEGKPMEFTLTMPKELPLVRGDSERIQQVLVQLLSNGYNYTPAAGKVKMHISTQDEMIQVDVQDNGIGIARDDQPRIFERFYRGEDPLVLATPGTGLGLAVSRTMVEMHHGKIWFTSNGVPGEGCLFSFTLPVYRPEE
jgi:PAS domain S-box-containing protein